MKSFYMGRSSMNLCPNLCKKESYPKRKVNMSVARIDPVKFLQVAHTILYGGRDATNLKDVFYSWSEKYEQQVFREVIKDQDDHDKSAVLSWVDRLNIANQLAVEYQYSNENSMTIMRLEDVHSHMTLSMRSLWSELRHIQYNLSTNNGRIFLGGEDEERLDRLINHIANSLCFSELEDETNCAGDNSIRQKAFYCTTEERD